MATTLSFRRTFKRSNHRVSPTYPTFNRCVVHPGKLFDEKTDLQNNLNRWYEPATGKWLSVDPIGYKDGINLYQYCGGNPVTRCDPSGLWTTTIRVIWPNPPINVVCTMKCWDIIQIFWCKNGIDYAAIPALYLGCKAAEAAGKLGKINIDVGECVRTLLEAILNAKIVQPPIPVLTQTLLDIFEQMHIDTSVVTVFTGVCGKCTVS
jgi:RHS repeat-associated protein